MAVCDTITMTDVCDILRIIVACMPEEFEATCRRINTFAYLNEVSDLNGESGSKTAKDSRKGEYYNRRWERQGRPMSGDSIYTHYPALAVDNNKYSYENICSKGWKTYPIQIWVFDLYRPDGQVQSDCPHCDDRTLKEVERDVEAMLEYVLREFKEFGKIVNTETGEEQWIHIGWWNNNNGEDTPFPAPFWKECCHTICPLIKPGVDAVRNWGGNQNLIYGAATVNLRVKSPITNEIQADYTNCSEC